ncbi:unconventional myosin-vi-like [Dermatophagoides farinae]|uniref:Carbonic anhydrase n=1 Tax=Dermatophagoides farinae TaxID=6954 RepID=A0A9D4P8P0_DERFA|nr:unconventional myosin-vi-like [Dermatophagoides farinae]
MEMKCLTILSIWWSLQMIIIIESINFGHNNHNNRELQSNIDHITKKLWDYRGPTGEQYWDKQYKYCKGHYQSPINIEMDRIVYVPNLQLSFINYDHYLFSMRMANNGHGVKLHQPPDMNDDHDDRLGCFVTGTALNNDIYRFVQFHFHWRNSHSSGSEHAINGNKFTMEMHIVHQNVRYDENEAILNRILAGDLFTVIAVFFNETDRHNKYLDPIIHHLDKIINVDSEYPLEQPLRLSDLLPDDKQTDFLRYYGSYTTPDCQEIVTWIIYPKPLDITSEQMNKFQK